MSYLAACRLNPVEVDPSRKNNTEKTVKVLIVEDDAALRTLLRDVLERAGISSPKGRAGKIAGAG